MPKSKRPAPNRTRERRIEEEIVVDAYTAEERAMSWNYYLEEKLQLPFKAKCIAVREISPLKKSEEVEFADRDGRTIALVTLVGSQIKPASNR